MGERKGEVRVKERMSGWGGGVGKRLCRAVSV